MSATAATVAGSRATGGWVVVGRVVVGWALVAWSLEDAGRAVVDRPVLDEPFPEPLGFALLAAVPGPQAELIAAAHASSRMLRSGPQAALRSSRSSAANRWRRDRVRTWDHEEKITAAT